MPGVKVLTGTIPGPGEAQVAPGSPYFLAGLTERGDTTKPVLVRSMGEYQQLLGNRVSYGSVYDTLSVFFGEGGTRAYVARVVGAAATVGTVTLKDQSGAGGINTLQINAKSVGAWSANITVQPLASALANQWKLLVFYSGAQVEAWGPFPDVATAVSVINAQSAYIAAVDLNSATAPPANIPLALGSPTALTAGTDQRGSVVSATYIAALALFTADLGSGMVAIPGLDASLVGSGLIAHAAANNRLAILAPTQGMSVASVIPAAAAFRGVAGSEFAGYFYPWVQIPDGSGGKRTIPPDGFVAGVHSRTQVTDGPWQPPAGAAGQARYVVSLEANVAQSDGDTLNDEHVNVIRPIAGIRLYGWRSLSTDTINYPLLTGRDTLNYIATLGKTALEQYVFDTVDAQGQLFGSMQATLRALLEPIRGAGGLFQNVGPDGVTLIDPGYIIDTGPSVNTPALLAQNEVAANVYVRVSPSAELILLSITKVAFGNPL